MKVYIPYVPERLEQATVAAAGEQAVLVDVSGDDEAYWRLLRDRWRYGSTFLLLEHDIVPEPGALAELEACPHDWCGIPYPVGNIWGVFHGCTKYGSSLIRRYPEAVRSMRVKSWDALDSQLIAYITRRQKEGAHWHWPAARHLNHRSVPPDHVFANCGDCGGPLRFEDLRAGPEANRCPRCGGAPAYHPLQRHQPVMRRRNDLASKLMYVGDGRRYLNGVPATDFETDDEALIAECLASELYVEIKAKTKEPEKEPPAKNAKAEAPAEAQTTPAE